MNELRSDQKPDSEFLRDMADYFDNVRGVNTNEVVAKIRQIADKLDSALTEQAGKEQPPFYKLGKYMEPVPCSIATLTAKEQPEAKPMRSAEFKTAEEILIKVRWYPKEHLDSLPDTNVIIKAMEQFAAQSQPIPDLSELVTNDEISANYPLNDKTHPSNINKQIGAKWLLSLLQTRLNELNKSRL